MRILVVCSLYPPAFRGGYEDECAGVADGLGRRHDVLVLASVHGRRAVGPEAGVLRTLPRTRLRKLDALLAPCTAARAARTTRRVLREFDPELIFIWNGSQIPHAAMRVMELSGSAVAYRISEHWFRQLHSGDPFMRYLDSHDRGLRGMWARLIRLVNRLHPALRLETSTRAPVAISWNSHAMATMTPRPRPLEPILDRTIHPATPQAAALATEMAGRERKLEEPPVIVFVGRVTSHKGAEVAYRAVAALRSRHSMEARLVLAGSCDRAMRRRLRRLERELGLAGRVELAGQLDSAGLATLLGRAHAVVIPSTWQEPWGFVCTEVALARVPLVVSRSGGLTEILAEDQALFFPIGDADACADALATTIADPAGAAARAERAHGRALELSLDRYLDESERFVADTIAAFSARESDGDGQATPGTP